MALAVIAAIADLAAEKLADLLLFAGQPFPVGVVFFSVDALVFPKSGYKRQLVTS